MAGMFDDLIPQQQASGAPPLAGGMFDDLVPPLTAAAVAGSAARQATLGVPRGWIDAPMLPTAARIGQGFDDPDGSITGTPPNPQTPAPPLPQPGSAATRRGPAERIARDISGALVGPSAVGEVGLEGARGKIGRKGYKDAGELTDLARISFVIKHPGEAESIIDRLRRQFTVLDEDWNTGPRGYSDRKVLVRGTDGTVGEVQIIPDAMYRAKFAGGGQDLYTQSRDMRRGPEKADREGQEAALYSAARRELGDDWGILERSSGANRLNVRRHSSSDSTAPVWATSSRSTRDQSSPGESTANASQPSSTAGRQSQLMNIIDDSSAPNIGESPESIKPVGQADGQVRVGDAGATAEGTVSNVGTPPSASPSRVGLAAAVNAVANATAQRDPDTPTEPLRPVARAFEQAQAQRTPAGAREHEAETLRRYGHTDAEISAMRPERRQARAGEAVEAGVSVARPNGIGTSEEPVTIQTGADVNQAARLAEQDHSPAQGEAGNTQLGHARWNGFDISIEAPAGGVRRGTAPDGAPFETRVGATYGYLRGVPKGADGACFPKMPRG